MLLDAESFVDLASANNPNYIYILLNFSEVTSNLLLKQELKKVTKGGTTKFPELLYSPKHQKVLYTSKKRRIVQKQSLAQYYIMD